MKLVRSIMFSTTLRIKSLCQTLLRKRIIMFASRLLPQTDLNLLSSLNLQLPVCLARHCRTLRIFWLCPAWQVATASIFLGRIRPIREPPRCASFDHRLSIRVTNSTACRYMKVPANHSTTHPPKRARHITTLFFLKESRRPEGDCFLPVFWPRREFRNSEKPCPLPLPPILLPE